MEPKKYVGYHPTDTLPIQPGHKVVIPAGVVVKSTNPSKREYITIRKQTIKVNHTICGSIALPWDKDGQTFNPTVNWAGTGGYWCWVDINDVLQVMERN